MTLRNAFEDLAVESTAANTNNILNDVYYPGFRSLRVISENETQFGETLTANRTPIIELNSSYGYSQIRDGANITGSGAIANNAGTIEISTGTTANSIARLESAEIGRYIPGYGAQIGIGIRVENANTINAGEILWGGIGNNNDNGVYFGYNANGYFVAVEKTGVVERIYQDDWNLDKLDGTGTSQYQINPNRGNIYQIEFTWYGYGQILFGVIAIVADGNYDQQHFIPCQSYRMDEGDTRVSLDTPNLRVFASVNNANTTNNIVAQIGGRQYSIVGNYIPKYRFSSEYRGSVATNSANSTPLVSFTRKNGFGDRSIKINSMSAIGSGATHILQIFLNPTLVSNNFANPTDYTPGETGLVYDNSATGFSNNGILLWQKLLPEGQGNQNVLSAAELDFDVPDTGIITLAAKTVTGTGTISVSFLEAKEEW
jgi:hypothetical protein